MRRPHQPAVHHSLAAHPLALAAAGVSLALALLVPTPAAVAHGTPVDLAFWGDFPLPVARCQRIIGRAAAACGLRVWRARRDCTLARFRGTRCDQDATADAIAAARVAALDAVSGACSPQQLSTLQFFDVREAQADVIRFCRDLEAATVSLVLAPLTAASPTSACGERTAWATTRILATAFRSRRQVLDRIAATSVGIRDKSPLVTTSTAAIRRTVMELAAAVGARCPADDFVAIFARDAAEILAAAGARADCLAGDAYAQGGVVCPAARCGDRIREGGEECDDGNARGGDGCTADCRREAATSGSPS